jgi:hypothetical protein
MSFQEQRIEVLSRENQQLRDELSRLKANIIPYSVKVVRAAEQHFQLPALTDKTRVARYVKARAVVARILRDEGYSLSEIGDALDRDHSSIFNLMIKHKPADFDVRAVRRLA